MSFIWYVYVKGLFPFNSIPVNPGKQGPPNNHKNRLGLQQSSVVLGISYSGT